MPRPKTKTTAILVKLSPAEKALIEERAGASGFPSVSEYLRQLGMGGAAPRRASTKATRPEGGAEPLDFEARVAELAKRMPRRSAEVVARREKARAAA